MCTEREAYLSQLRVTILKLTIILKYNKIVPGFGQNKKKLFYIYLDDMFRPIDHHQAIFIKPRIRSKA
jgi:hypothetical protein